ncbi:MAG: OB-fold domain-containing protein [Acidimicrobiia bacterium]|nr:OB-fold domain-containing protein [Acidimicrobiia bacterium]
MDGLVEAVAPGAIALIGGWSATSGKHHFPRAEVCPYTGADDVERVLLPTTGRLWLWTAVTAAPPGYSGPVPYGLGVVALDGIDLLVAGRLTEADPAALAEGQPMVLVADLDVWAWAPA